MSRRLLLALVLLTVGAGVLRLWALSGQVPTNDDAGVAYSASNWVLHGQATPSMPFHPRLRDYLTFASLAALGRGWLGLKFWSVLLGTLSVPVLGMIVWRISRNPVATLLAAGLMALDGVMIDYSRQAIQEVHAAFFLLLGTYLVIEAVVRGPSAAWRWLLPCAGAVYGLGVSSKFYAVPPLMVSVVLLLWMTYRRRMWPEAVFVATTLVVVPLAIYLATYAPWFARGYSLADWLHYQRGVLLAMASHTRDTGFLRFASPAQWFVVPFTGFADAALRPDGSHQLSVATGNPLVWLAVWPAIAYSIVRKRHRRAHQLMQAYFWAGYLPLALAGRPVWVLSSVAVLPFAFALIALVAADLWRRFGAMPVLGYAAAVVAVSMLLYPLAIGRALDHEYLRPVVERVGFEQLVSGGQGASP